VDVLGVYHIKRKNGCSADADPKIAAQVRLV